MKKLRRFIILLNLNSYIELLLQRITEFNGNKSLKIK